MAIKVIWAAVIDHGQVVSIKFSKNYYTSIETASFSQKESCYILRGCNLLTCVFLRLYALRAFASIKLITHLYNLFSETTLTKIFLKSFTDVALNTIYFCRKCER